MLKQQGIKLALVEPEPLSTAASRILDIVIRDVSSVQCRPDTYAFTRSGGSEVLDFLKDRALMSLAPALAHQGITSLRELLLLRGSELEAERRRVVQAAVESSARPGGGGAAVDPTRTMVLLNEALEVLARDPRSGTMRQRLAAFRYMLLPLRLPL